MLPRRNVVSVLLIAASITSVQACADEAAVTEPRDEEATSAVFDATVGSSAVIFIAEAFGGNLYRYEVFEGGGAIDIGAIALGGSARGIAFGPTGEMFVATTAGGISRFLDPEAAATPNGVITAGNTGAPFGGQPQWSDFRDAELFQAQESGTVLRFAFDGAGNAVFNGTVAAAGNTRGLRVNRATAELFVSQITGSVQRFVFDAAGNVTPNGTVTGGGLGSTHGVAFSLWGEMLVANFGGTISRFTFDGSGNAVPNGVISGGGMAGPLDLDFSPWGELFVTNHGSNPGFVTRWLFTSPDPSGTAVQNGSFTLPATVGVMRFAHSGGTGDGRPDLSADSDAVPVQLGDVATNSGAVSDPEGDPVALTASVGSVMDNGDGTWSWAYATASEPVGSQTVLISADDGHGPVVSTSFTVYINQHAPAMLFIGEAWGGRFFRYEVSDGGMADLDHTITTNVSQPGGFAFGPSGELFVSNGIGTSGGPGNISRYLDPEDAATANGVITAATGAPFQQPQWITFRNGEVFLAQSNGVILRFGFDAAGNAVFNGTIGVGGNARGILAHPVTGELFVSDLGNSIARFLFDGSGNPVANGFITGGGMNHTHGMVVTAWGELLIANFHGNSISRFVFDAAGNAVSNGIISGGDMAGPLDLDFSPWGELFVTNHQQIPARVTRWVFSSGDASSTATYNGSFTVQAGINVLRFAGSSDGGGGGPVNTAPSITVDLDPVAVDEGDVATSSGTVVDPDGDPVTLTASIGTVTNHDDGTWSWSLATTDGPAESQTVTIAADDGAGGEAVATFALVVNNVSPMPDPVSVPAAPVDIGNQSIIAMATFTDPAGSADEAYSCTVDYGDGTGLLPGIVSGTGCTGPEHVYAEPGVYSVTVAVSDKDGGTTDLTAESFVVIYDPSGGFVTGGGWIESPAGAYVADPLLTGKANFGFVSKYGKGASIPTGNTEFHFRAGGLNFHSSEYDWLVVNQRGANAQFFGSGTINGQPSPGGSNYRFMIWAGDDDPDTFRIRIWYESNGEVAVYDNGFDQAIGGGSIRVHGK